MLWQHKRTTDQILKFLDEGSRLWKMLKLEATEIAQELNAFVVAEEKSPIPVPIWLLQLSVTPIQRDSVPSFGQHAHTDMHAGKHTPIK